MKLEEYSKMYKKMEVPKEMDDIKERVEVQTERRVWRMRKKVSVLALAGVLCIGTIVVAASELPKLWNSTVAKMYKTVENDIGSQEKLINEGYVDVINTEKADNDVVSVTKNGITISVKQTLSDKYGIKVYLDVKSINGLKLSDGNRVFEENDIYVKGQDEFQNTGGGFVEKEYQISDYERIYELYGVNELGTDMVGKEIRIHLANLKGGEGKLDDAVLVEGDWDLHWILKSNSATKKIQLKGDFVGKSVVQGETFYAKYNLKSLEISPFSYNLEYECKDYGENSVELDNEPIPIKVVMKNGEVYSMPAKDDGHALNGPGEQDDTHHLVTCMDIAIDVENIDYIEVAGVKYE